FWKHIPRLFRAHQENPQIFDAALFLKLLYNGFRYEFLRLKINMQMKVFNPLGCSSANDGDPRAADLTSVIVQLKEYFEKCFDTIRTSENDPVVNMRILHQLREGTQIAWRLDPDRRQFDHLSAERAKFVT